MEPKTIGALFVYFYRYPQGMAAPVLNVHGWTRETETPFRVGYCWLLRIPFTRTALVVGHWHTEYGDELEDEALLNALDARLLRLGAEDIRTWR